MDSSFALNCDLAEVKTNLTSAQQKCCARGLMQSSKWSSELAFCLKKVKPCTEYLRLTDEEIQDFDRFNLSYSYLLVREYDRAAHFAEECVSAKGHFLHLYSKYLSLEKKKVDNLADPSAPLPNDVSDEPLRNLRAELQREYTEQTMDGFTLYLYGVVLKKLDLLKPALDILTEATHKEPLHWGSWFELATLIPDKETLNSLNVPDHWMKYFFLARTYLELQMNDEALNLLVKLQDVGFNDSTYLMAQIAIGFHNIRDVDKAVNVFQDIRKIDPYRLDNMDTYSNLLYVKEMRVELSYLAHHACGTDKYRAETCCVIGNYYSLRAQHEKAVLYFQRALKLNPNYLSAWTLMGHEYMEMKNASAAIQCYRHAIELNRRDYRAWYGLGQTYEIIKMPYYGLYYYRQAHQLRPTDSRMVVALGEAYEKVDKLQEAKKCFWKAHSMADIEEMALIKLAKLYERLQEEDQAAAAYTDFIKQCEIQGITGREDQGHAYKYLANYYLKKNRVEEAYLNAQKCIEYNETKEEAKAVLRQIAQLRSQEGVTMQVDEDKDSVASTRFRSRTDTAGSERLSPINLMFTP